MLRVGAATITAGLTNIAPALAQATEGTVRIRNTGYDAIAVEVRVGQTEDRSVNYGTRTLKKGEDWTITANLPVFWRREVNPGSGDGKMTDWKRVVPSPTEQTAVELNAA